MKAITYSAMKIYQDPEKGRYELFVIIDIWRKFEQNILLRAEDWRLCVKRTGTFSVENAELAEIS